MNSQIDYKLVELEEKPKSSSYFSEEQESKFLNLCQQIIQAPNEARFDTILDDFIGKDGNNLKGISSPSILLLSTNMFQRLKFLITNQTKYDFTTIFPIFNIFNILSLSSDTNFFDNFCLPENLQLFYFFFQFNGPHIEVLLHILKNIALSGSNYRNIILRSFHQPGVFENFQKILNNPNDQSTLTTLFHFLHSLTFIPIDQSDINLIIHVFSAFFQCPHLSENQKCIYYLISAFSNFQKQNWEHSVEISQAFTPIHPYLSQIFNNILSIKDSSQLTSEDKIEIKFIFLFLLCYWADVLHLNKRNISVPPNTEQVNYINLEDIPFDLNNLFQFTLGWKDDPDILNQTFSFLGTIGYLSDTIRSSYSTDFFTFINNVILESKSNKVLKSGMILLVMCLTNMDSQALTDFYQKNPIWMMMLENFGNDSDFDFFNVTILGLIGLVIESAVKNGTIEAVIQQLHDSDAINTLSSWQYKNQYLPSGYQKAASALYSFIENYKKL